MYCAHCGGRLFQDAEDVDRWACILCRRSPQQQLWQSQAERLVEFERGLYAARRRGVISHQQGAAWIRTGNVRLG